MLLLGILTGDVLIFAHRRVNTLTQYLTWFSKLSTSTGESIIRDRLRNVYNTHGGGGSLHSTLLPALIVALVVAALATAIAILISFSLHTLSTFSFLFCSQIMPLFIGILWRTIMSAFVLEWNRYGFSISEFQLGRYLGVPLISGKLNDVDCMLLGKKSDAGDSRGAGLSHT